jgi:S-formylglutathione hydrolase
MSILQTCRGAVSCAGRRLGLGLMAALAVSSAWGQPVRAGGPHVPATGTALQVQVHSKAIEGNLSGDPALRDVSIYLPASYSTAPWRRYPVLYMLHGSGETHMTYFQPTAFTNIPVIADRAFAAGSMRDMIIVTPNGRNLYGGSNYSSGATTGDYESFISKELVAYMDSNYRTVARREGRGLAGHSMGGYGTWRIGMKHPDVFSAIYVLSSCCISTTSNLTTNPTEIANFQSWYAASIAAGVVLPRPNGIGTNVQAAAAWAPNPLKHPVYFDIPFEGGQQVRAVVDRMSSNRPLAMVDQYIGALRQLQIGFDVGNADTNIAANLTEMSRVLTSYQVQHKFEVYEGNHTNRIPERFETRVLPFFSRLFLALPSH